MLLHLRLQVFSILQRLDGNVAKTTNYPVKKTDLFLAAKSAVVVDRVEDYTSFGIV